LILLFHTFKDNHILINNLFFHFLIPNYIHSLKSKYFNLAKFIFNHFFLIKESLFHYFIILMVSLSQKIVLDFIMIVIFLIDYELKIQNIQFYRFYLNLLFKLFRLFTILIELEN
jgi:hypothetical protein